MTPVQWILLILVIAVVIGVYAYMRHQASEDPWKDMDATQQDNSADESVRQGESLGGDSYVVGVRTVGQDEPGQPPEPAPQPGSPEQAGDQSWKNFGARPEQPPAAAPPPKPTRPKKHTRKQSAADAQDLFIVHVCARNDQQFDGPDVHAALEAQKLSFGLNAIYHRIIEVHGAPESVYSVANTLKPGFLDPMEQDQLRTPGLTLFLMLPGPVDGAQAARDMLDTAHALAERLGGDVLDDKRSLLKAQTEQYMFDRVAEVDRLQRVRARR